MGFVYDKDLIGYINIFENITKVKVKGCHKSDNELIFIIDPMYISKAIGKNGVNVKEVSRLLRKTIKIVGYDSDVTKFIKNLIAPIDGKIYKESEEVIAIRLTNNKDKGLVIGRDKKNINNIQNIVSSFFSVKIRIL